MSRPQGERSESIQSPEPFRFTYCQRQCVFFVSRLDENQLVKLANSQDVTEAVEPVTLPGHISTAIFSLV